MQGLPRYSTRTWGGWGITNHESRITYTLMCYAGVASTSQNNMYLPPAGFQCVRVPATCLSAYVAQVLMHHVQYIVLGVSLARRHV